MKQKCGSCKAEAERLYLVRIDGKRRFVCRRCEDRIEREALRKAGG